MIASRILLLIGISLALMGSNCDKVVPGTLGTLGTLGCGGVLYVADGSEGNAGTLRMVDPTTAAETVVGPIGHGVTGMAVAPYPDCTIYGTTATVGTNGELITIDPASGAGTVVGPTTDGVSLHSSIADLTFAGSKLYGWSEDGDDLVTIDTATGAVTVIPSPLGTAGSGLATDSTGTLYHVNSGGDINIIDPATGTPTLVVNSGPYNQTPDAATFIDGTLYVLDAGEPGALNPIRLVTVDLTTGATTEVGPLTRTVGPPLISPDALAYSGGATPTPLMVSFQEGVGGYAGTQDAELREDTPAGNFGTGVAVTVDGDDPVASGFDAHALMRFDGIFGAGPGQIPPGSTIVSATLELYVVSGGNDVDMLQMTAPWGELTATWSNLPGGTGVSGSGATFLRTLIGRPTAGSPLFTTGVSQTFDVTTEVQNWSNGATNLGWGFVPSSTLLDDGVDFASKESVVNPKPKLTVQYY